MLLIPSRPLSIPERTARDYRRCGREFCAERIHVLHESQQQSGIGSGLEEGESVVVSGLFLIDSEANITGALERMRHAEAADDAHSGH
jgi:Cu(I)/Ag(I) efflux system membrane fusion protein